MNIEDAEEVATDRVEKTKSENQGPFDNNVTAAAATILTLAEKVTAKITPEEDEEVPEKKLEREPMTPGRLIARIAKNPKKEKIEDGAIYLGAAQRKALGIKEGTKKVRVSSADGELIGEFTLKLGAKELLNLTHEAFDYDACLLGKDLPENTRLIITPIKDDEDQSISKRVEKLSEKEEKIVTAQKEPRKQKSPECAERITVRIAGRCKSDGEWIGMHFGMREALGVEKGQFVDAYDIEGKLIGSFKVVDGFMDYLDPTSTNFDPYAINVPKNWNERKRNDIRLILKKSAKKD